MHTHHHHVDPATAHAHAAALWKLENVELLTVGVDIGSSTSHVLFARLHLHRRSESLSGRFVVVAREILHRSSILLTPYRPDGLIDVEALAPFIEQCYVAAQLRHDDVDTGAVILTGAALERANASAVAELFASEGGRFVCASAGHNLEAILAAHGSGAVELSHRLDGSLLHLDIGGGTTKISLIRCGEVQQTATVNVGGRLVALDVDDRITRVEPAAEAVASWLGIDLGLGRLLSEAEQNELSQQLVEVLLETASGGPLSDRARALLATQPLTIDPDDPPRAVTFSGGVAEYIYDREATSYRDLGASLADALSRHDDRLPVRLASMPVEGIRATVVGASQFTVQLSGNTLYVTDPTVLPLHNLPVAYASLAMGDLDQFVVAEAIRSAFQRLDIEEGERPAVLALSWRGRLSYQNLRALAEGIMSALPRSIRGGSPLAVVLEIDLAHSLGALLSEELDVSADLVVIDGLELLELDYIDIGQLIQPTNVVPVVIKSLAFPGTSIEPPTVPPHP